MLSYLMQCSHCNHETGYDAECHQHLSYSDSHLLIHELGKACLRTEPIVRLSLNRSFSFYASTRYHDAITSMIPTSLIISNDIIERMEMKRQLTDLLNKHGLNESIRIIMQAYVSNKRPDLTITWLNDADIESNDAIAIDFKQISIGEIYETMLALNDKHHKKDNGIYYTPDDVAEFMADKMLALFPFDDMNSVLIEPCVGTGNLLMPFIDNMPSNVNKWDFITNRLIINDLDENAVLITKTMLAVKYAPEGITADDGFMRACSRDFLIMNIPDDAYVIMNPPYGRTDNENYSHYETYNIHDLYALFMEHAVKHAKTTVSVTPQSFLGSLKYDSLRRVIASHANMNAYAFDNVPQSLFNGRKHGVFNTNTSNSVRACIEIMDTRNGNNTIRCTPMIRWQSNERNALFTAAGKFMNNAFIQSYERNQPFRKIPAGLEHMVESLDSCEQLSSLYEDGEYTIHVPSTPRYATTATVMNINRSSMIDLKFDDDNDMMLAYAIMNSSIAYMWWRMIDGGITITNKQIAITPIPALTDKQKCKLFNHVRSMIANEHNHLTIKLNAGKNNENVKWNQNEILELNKLLLPAATEHELNAMDACHSPSLKTQMNILPND